MKRRFMAILLAGGLMLGLCGCEDSVSIDADEYMEQLRQEEASRQEPMSEISPEGLDMEDYSIDKLVEMWSSGVLTEEDLGRKVATGEISYETYEEFLSYIGDDNQEFDIARPEETLEGNNPAGDIDTSGLLTAHMVEYEDQDGYTIRETCQLSPIFTEDDAETMYALWEALGQDATSFPSEESLYNASYLLRDARDTCNCNKLEYIIGTYTIENLTEGFPITPDSPRTYAGQLATKHVSATDREHDATAADFFNVRSVVTVVQSSDTVCYAEQDAVIFGKATMDSNTWGPYTFVIALPNGITPNRPDGYRYDKIPVILSAHAYFYSDYDAFGLTYFEDY